jgi:hypothetical protein
MLNVNTLDVKSATDLVTTFVDPQLDVPHQAQFELLRLDALDFLRVYFTQATRAIEADMERAQQESLANAEAVRAKTRTMRDPR